MEYKIFNATECAIIYKDSVCLLHRSNNSEHYPNYQCFPGGRIDDNEDPLKAVIREVFEETGIKLSGPDLKLCVIEYNYHDDEKELWIVFTFKVTLDYLPTFIESNEGKPEFINIINAKTLDLIPQTKDYFDHATSVTNKVMLINQHFVKDAIVGEQTKDLV